LDIHLWEWGALVAFITVLLVTDLLLVHRKPHDIEFKEAAIESAVWISIGLAFSGAIYYLGRTSGIVNGVHGVDVGSSAVTEYLSGFLLEKSLSVDNVFIWAVIFSYFAVPKRYQFRVLFWGIFGALMLRAIFIFAGSALIERFTVTLAVFGVILLYTAYKLAFQEEDHKVDPDTSIVLRVVRKVIPSTDKLDGQKLFTHVDGRRLATPLFAVLVMVESTDVVFAVDSVPAIFGVSREPFIVFSSNAFAILGLRALYFLLGGMQDKFRYLNYGLGAILAWVGVKMMITWTVAQFEWPSADFHMPTWLSLGVIVLILTVTIVASLQADKRDPQPPKGHAADDGHVGALLGEASDVEPGTAAGTEAGR
ncbi:MAG: TerC family protein, partial [Acidimicrobiales bacterium]|nr:TerC family protein [Acidimicrobiales bacterium]